MEEGNQQAEQEIRKTTLREYFRACHEHLHIPLIVGIDREWTTRGTLVAKDKFYPKDLKPWTSFMDI